MALEYLPVDQRNIALQAFRWGSATPSERLTLYMENADYRRLYFSLPAPEPRAFEIPFHAFDLFQKLNDNLCTEALNFMDDRIMVQNFNKLRNQTKCTQILNMLSRIDQQRAITVFEMIDQPLRLNILQNLKSKETLLDKITRRQEKAMGSKENQTGARYLATKGFLSRIARPARQCIRCLNTAFACSETYRDGEELHFKLCDKHTFCSRCVIRDDLDCLCKPTYIVKLRLGFGWGDCNSLLDSW